MVGKLDSISRDVKHASAPQILAAMRFPTIVVWCRPILSADSYYYSNQDSVRTGWIRWEWDRNAQWPRVSQPLIRLIRRYSENGKRQLFLPHYL